MNQKLTELNATIEAKATELGLVFVDGPDSRPVALTAPSTGVTNYQPRGVYLFAVAEGAQ